MIFTALARRAAGIVSRTMAPTLRARRPASTNVASAQEKPIAEKKTGRKRRIKATEASADEDLPKEKAVRASKSRKSAELSKKEGPTWAMQIRLAAKGYSLIAGVDEAGRGPLAGPVVAAACIIPQEVAVPGLTDSKKMTEEQREAAYEILTTDERVTWAVAEMDAAKIDEVNILQATMLAMEKAVASLKKKPDYVVIDGNRVPAGLDQGSAEAVVKGDLKVMSVAAASVLAKVHRDRMMMEYDAKWPQYGFARHKGYPTAAHVAAIKEHGPCPIHRMTFAPLKPT